MPPSEARTFTDLIYRATGWWPHLDPTQAVGVGTYGIVNKDTGRFHPIGNLYHDPDVIDKIPELALPESEPTQGQISEKEWAVWTDKESKWNFNVDPGVSLTSILDGDVKLQFDLAPRKRSAFLIMDRFQTISLPPRGLLPKIAKVKELKDMCIVTDVRVCSAYVLGLTSRGTMSVNTNANVSLPVPAALGMTASSSIGGGWSSNASVTFHEEGSKLPDPKHYTTLLTLKVLTNSWKTRLFGGLREAGKPQSPTEEAFENIALPWGELDYEGNASSREEEVYDNPDSPGSEDFPDDI
ncbi:hypothetical protein FRB95_011612 [Tulasnella sp. JGI-2019a]|nr:hypothetical protein FRB95_011612 [Tulasnella sp. JGI-2019a]